MYNRKKFFIHNCTLKKLTQHYCLTAILKYSCIAEREKFFFISSQYRLIVINDNKGVRQFVNRFRGSLNSLGKGTTLHLYYSFEKKHFFH